MPPPPPDPPPGVVGAGLAACCPNEKPAVGPLVMAGVFADAPKVNEGFVDDAPKAGVSAPGVVGALLMPKGVLLFALAAWPNVNVEPGFEADWPIGADEAPLPNEKLGDACCCCPPPPPNEKAGAGAGEAAGADEDEAPWPKVKPGDAAALPNTFVEAAGGALDEGAGAGAPNVNAG